MKIVSNSPFTKYELCDWNLFFTNTFLDEFRRRSILRKNIAVNIFGIGIRMKILYIASNTMKINLIYVKAR